ncbi:type II toxin-antitoxin system RelE/ParE family toxin [Bradyrhizobium sp. Arg314]
MRSTAPSANASRITATTARCPGTWKYCAISSARRMRGGDWRDPFVECSGCKAHLIVYRVEEGGDVFIVRVRHGHEDWAGTAA